MIIPKYAVKFCGSMNSDFTIEVLNRNTITIGLKKILPGFSKVILYYNIFRGMFNSRISDFISSLKVSTRCDITFSTK